MRTNLGIAMKIKLPILSKNNLMAFGIFLRPFILKYASHNDRWMAIVFNDLFKIGVPVWEKPLLS